MAILLMLALTILQASADHDNFPVKSLNLDQADAIGFYKPVQSESFNVDDAHPVHGIETSDGGFVLVGKGLESESSPNFEAFAVKTSSSGAFQWVWKSGAVGSDVANSIVQLPGGGDLLVAGYRTISGVAKRSLTKLALSSGAESWTSTDFGDASGSHGAWESVDLTTAGDALLLGGFHQKPDTEEMSFKSYGNVPNGRAVVLELPTAVLAGGAPSASDASWTRTFTDEGHITCKAVRPLANGDSVALLWGEAPAAYGAALVLLSSTGTVSWGPNKLGAEHGEGTDVAVVSDGGFVMSGHGADASGKLVGRITKVSSGGVREWTKSYSAGGLKYIKNECWGVQSLGDGGHVMSCGTGIEDCGGMDADPSLKADCAAGRPVAADPRPGAHPRKAAVWQSLVVRTDATGALRWQRVDQYREAGAPALGSADWSEHSSASEHVLKCADGSLAFVQDEVFGVGIMKLVQPTSGGGGATSAPVAATAAPTTGTLSSTSFSTAQRGQGVSGFVVSLLSSMLVAWGVSAL